MTGCIDDNAIAALLDAALPAAEREVLTAHLDTCEICRTLVAQTVDGDGDGPRVLPPGHAVGRYIVLDLVGAGAMGVVYAAHDPELRRKVALKVLRPDPEVGGSSPARERLLREAQALARLAHPNVIAIHDVGALDDEIFIAMELVENGTLGEWLAAAPRTSRAIVSVMRQVGEGLAAAHAAGLVHRDLKPDNVLVGADGRARVTDFGLSRGAGEHVDAAPGALPPSTLTMTGAVMGTPAYMAPEQRAGGAANEASDQFSFCVTFHEALCGARPFTATGARVPPARRVPSWLRRIIDRGLAADPAARFPSLRALLDAVERGSRTRRGPLALALGAVVLGGVAFAVTRPAPAACTGGPMAWRGAWGEREAAATREAFARTGRPDASSAAARVTAILDEAGGAWQAMHREVCEATTVRGEQSAAVMDLRMRCLGARRSEIAALARLFATADGELVDRAVSAALALPTLADCANPRALAALPADPATRARIEQLAGGLAEASALEFAGAYDRGTTVATAALGEARALGYGPLTAKLLLVAGRLAAGQHDLARAEAALQEAAALAVETGDDAVAADAWTTLVRIVGFHFSKPDEARVWDRYAEGAIRRLEGDDEREATRLRALATVAWRREGKFDEARALIAQARRLYERSQGAHHDFEIASCDEGLAGIDFDTGRAADALVLHERVAAVRERLFGTEHPSLAIADVNRGEDLLKLGRPDEAIPLITRGLAIMAPVRAHGGDAYFHHRLAAALRAKQQFAEALAEDERALAANALAGDRGGYWESWSLTGQGLDLIALGRPSAAIQPLERAVAERATDLLAIEVAETKFALARALGDGPRAQALAREARDVLAPDAKRFGAWYAELAAEIDRWLARK